MTRIAIFASGNGTNAENIIKYFQNKSFAQVVMVLSNNQNAKVIERAKNLSITGLVFSRKDLYDSEDIITFLKEKADFIVLAGFIWKIPQALIEAFPNKIINIHPALLPKHGGKGMYGMFVHEAVKKNREKVSGITIHYVNGRYDEGSIIFQKEVALLPTDSPEDIAIKIHQLEYQYFPRLIGQLLSADNKADMPDIK